MARVHVIKVGGAAGIALDPVCDDVAALVRKGERVILVHGGSAELNEVSAKLGHPPRFVTSPSGHTSRVTDRTTLAMFTMVYCGKRNKEIVELLQARDVNAIGLSGADGRLWEGRRKPAIRYVDEKGKTKVLRDDYTGRVDVVNVSLLDLLLDAGYTPVLTPPAISYESELINVDGDRGAAKVASAMRADTLVILSNVPGVLRDLQDPGSVIGRIEVESMDDVFELAGGRMKKKLLGAREAIEEGVVRVVLASANADHPVLEALDGVGTVIESAGV
jgi:acetylglutamate/LysW-gamma-L-alpha-aminoadipate kinase